LVARFSGRTGSSVGTRLERPGRGSCARAPCLRVRLVPGRKADRRGTVSVRPAPDECVRCVLGPARDSPAPDAEVRRALGRIRRFPASDAEIR